MFQLLKRLFTKSTQRLPQTDMKKKPKEWCYPIYEAVATGRYPFTKEELVEWQEPWHPLIQENTICIPNGYVNHEGMIIQTKLIGWSKEAPEYK